MKFFAFALILILTPHARAFDYFSGEINYWKEPKPPPKEVQNEPQKPLLKEEPKPDEKKFDWQKFKDPKNTEFFKEGEHTPPEPFMELARNPSDENIKQWFAVIEAKNELMGNLSRRIAEYSSKHSPTLNTEEREVLAQKEEKLKPKEMDFKRFRFRLYFDSACPHCKNMMATMVEIQNIGFYVEVKQIDKARPDYPVPFPVTPASPEELKEKKISSWPVLFVADTDKKLLYRINGYSSTQEVLTQLSSK